MMARCAARGCTRRAAHLHHVVYRQEVTRRGGNLKDERNLMPLCFDCHFAHHARQAPVPLELLADEAFVFARELLGPFAFDYLGRRYAGRDARLDALLS